MKRVAILIPNKPIPRIDEYGKEFGVFFSKESIKSIFEKFNNNGQYKDLCLFINNKENDKYNSDIPEGSLMGFVPEDHDGGLSFEFK